MTADLTVTNVLLGIMAVVSLLEALAVVALLFAGFRIYRRVMQTIAGIEERHVAPAATRVNAILDDVRTVTETARRRTQFADDFISGLFGAIWRRWRRSSEKEAS